MLQNIFLLCDCYEQLTEYHTVISLYSLFFAFITHIYYLYTLTIFEVNTELLSRLSVLRHLYVHINKINENMYRYTVYLLFMSKFKKFIYHLEK